MEQLRDLLANSNASFSPPGSWSDYDGTCRRCSEEFEIDDNGMAIAHRCCTCLDTKRVRLRKRVGDPDFGKAVECPDCAPTAGAPRPAEEWEDVARWARIPLRYQNAILPTATDIGATERKLAYDWAATWPPPSLLIYGDTGTGKTHMACGLIHEVWRRHNKRGLWVQWEGLIARYRACFSNVAQETESSIDAEMDRAPLLVLDDIGVVDLNDHATKSLFRLIDRRYGERKPTIITSNMDFLKLDERIRSRLASGRTIKLGGPDRRYGETE